MSLNILNMSDEELMKLDPEQLEQAAAEGGTAAEEEGVSSEDQSSTEEEPTDGGSTSEDQTSEDSGEEEEEEGEEGAGQAGAVEAGDEGAEASDASGEGQATGKEDKGGEAVTAEAVAPEVAKAPAENTGAEDKAAIEAEYKKLLAPFTANGKEMSVKNVDEAITLMQMGANYNKKMAALKPNLKLLKLLESNGLLDEEKLSYLIDLSNKDAGAINKLVKDSGIDPMDLASEKADEYKPTVRSVNDKEIELDLVLEEIQESPAYQRTLKVVGKEWDVESRKVVADTPQLLKVINSHVQTGIYDMIVAEVERERMFGRLTGVPDIEAYRQVGDAIQARGGFNHLATAGQGQPTSAAPVVVQPKPKQADDERLKDKRRAAAPATTSASSNSSAAKDFNPLAMSDEEFAKLVKPDFM